METPSKKPEGSTMKHEEEEEMQHDISKLCNQLQQISHSQKVTKAKMDGLKNCMEAKLDGLKNDMEANIDGIKRDMGVLNDGLKSDMEAMMNIKIEGLKEGLVKLLEEKCPSCDKAIHENHDEDKRNINYDFTDFTILFKNHHIPKIEMREFDGRDPVTWII